MADKPGLLLIISGPSGVGKTTIARHVEQHLEGIFSVSVTTRPQTFGDRAGVDYQFVDHDQFASMRDAGELLEWAQVFGNMYGTPKQPVLDAVADGRLMILEIDVQGGIQVKANMPDALAIFVEPPGEQALLDRLRGRKRDDEPTIQRRFAQAKAEIASAKQCGAYDVFIVNGELQTALDEAVQVVRHRMIQVPRTPNA